MTPTPRHYYTTFNWYLGVGLGIGTTHGTFFIMVPFLVIAIEPE